MNQIFRDMALCISTMRDILFQFEENNFLSHIPLTLNMYDNITMVNWIFHYNEHFPVTQDGDALFRHFSITCVRFTNLFSSMHNDAMHILFYPTITETRFDPIDDVKCQWCLSAFNTENKKRLFQSVVWIFNHSVSYYKSVYKHKPTLSEQLKSTNEMPTCSRCCRVIKLGHLTTNSSASCSGARCALRCYN